jgi:dolichol-phosphate mannosyltransferase
MNKKEETGQKLVQPRADDLPFEVFPSGLAVELAVVIPAYNERENIAPLLAALKTVLVGIQWEVIFVDDNSPDGTAETIRAVAISDRRVRVIERIGRRGLSSACIEGMLSTAAPYIAVLDADLQHDESILPEMLYRMKAKQLDIVVGSRKVAGGSMGDFSRARVWLSSCGAKIAKLLQHCEITDAMSGFFLVDRNFFREVVHRLTGAGFKILLDLAASSPRPVRLEEVPYHFRARHRGESKLDANAELEYLFLVVDKIVGRYIPTRFVIFVLVGSLGLILHLATLGLLYFSMHREFVFSQTLATIFAMTFNFLLNNLVTFRDRRVRGWRLVTGLLTFYLACSVGALTNISFARFMLNSGAPWYLAGISGMAISSVWNYGVNTVFTWRRGRS